MTPHENTVQAHMEKMDDRVHMAVRFARRIWDSWVVCDRLRWRGWV